MTEEELDVLRKAEKIMRAHEVHDIVLGRTVNVRCCYRHNTTPGRSLAEAVEYAAKVPRADGYDDDKAYG